MPPVEVSVRFVDRRWISKVDKIDLRLWVLSRLVESSRVERGGGESMA